MSSPEPPPSPFPPKPPRKVPRRRSIIDPELLKDSVQNETWIERLRRQFFAGAFGFGVSLTVHAIVMIVLALIVIKIQTVKQDELVATWSNVIEKGTNHGRKFKAIDLPVGTPLDLGPAPKKGAVSKSTGEGTGATAPDGTGQGGVSPVDGSGLLGSRNPRMRGSNLDQLGGSNDTERAIKQGLMWLSRQQKSDGHWELHQGYPDHGFPWAKTDTGATALSLMAFLGQGNTHQNGEFAEVVKKGLTWLQAIQDPETGDFHDMRREEGREGAFYAHSMATIAICEALALTEDQQLKQSAEKAVKYLLYSQHPENGGWKFRPINKLMVGDLAVTGWALMALHTARMAGIDVPHEDFVRASAFLDSVKVRGMSRYKFEPISPDNQASAAMTAEAILCRQWFGWPKNLPEMVEGVRYITTDDLMPSWTEGKRNVFRWYYTSQVLHNIGGEDWKRWGIAVRNAIVKNQNISGSGKGAQDVRGSWNSTSPVGDPREFAEKGGRLYITALCILILETPYRHQAIYAADK